MTNCKPLVSIITPTYNSIQFIDKSIKSIVDQTYPYWELLITDDCSTDGTWELLKEYQRQNDLIKISRLEKNSGSGIARNNSIKNAKGKYIAFLDSDDYWIPEKLEIQVNFMEHNNIAFCHSSYGYWDEKGKEMRKPYIVGSHPITYKDLLKKTEISCLTAIYNQKVIGKVYMPNLRRKQDYALWLSILKKGYKSYPQKEVLAYYRQRRGSATNKKHTLIISHYQFLRTQENLSSINALKYTVYWIWSGLVKYYL